MENLITIKGALGWDNNNLQWNFAEFDLVILSDYEHTACLPVRVPNMKCFAGSKWMRMFEERNFWRKIGEYLSPAVDVFGQIMMIMMTWI